MRPRISINLSSSPRLVSCFHLLLIKGVILTATSGTSVRSFLVDTLGIEADYLATRMQTILLNGQAVDDLDTAEIHEGAVLALSAAMPGLAGAVLRSKGILRGLRQEISLNGQIPQAGGGPVSVTVKLFNAVLQDLAPLLLCRDMTVDGKDLWERLVGHREELLRGGACLSIDDRPADLTMVEGFSWIQGPVCFQITGIGQCLPTSI